jgi:NAD(P)-dependent dehydrogenase (short-subunit alcohol dehydrogenase family)/rhamnose utilization protein RhaD (predicted bifunctional aldolase and dehydrogenase)
MIMEEKHLADLITISRHYGSDKNYVIAGGGNTSYKDKKDIWVKASGTNLGSITLEGFAVLHRELLQEMYSKKYSQEPEKREAEVKSDLYRACHQGIKVRPSVETSLHEIINYPFVVHTHPTLVNAITCSNRAEETIASLFGSEVLFIPCTDPGYILFTRIRDLLWEWRKNRPADPKIIFLQNHGVFVASDTVEEVKALYSRIDSVIRKQIRQLPDTSRMEVPAGIVRILPALRMIFSVENVKIAGIRNHQLAQKYFADAKSFSQVSLPFTPDQIVYCKARAIYLEQNTPDAIIEECKTKLESYKMQHGYPPKMAVLKGYGIVAFEDSSRSVETMLDVFDDWMKISSLTENFGGPHFMTTRDIAFIDSWEVENYRRQIAKASATSGKAENKVIVVTGGAQGFGGGIAETMMAEGANVVIADLNEEKGIEITTLLNKNAGKNRAVYVKTDVSVTASVENLMIATVQNFGGFDVFISNAGILRAGGLEEMNMETFELMTRVNYSAYFLCTKYASEVLKLQSQYRPGYFSDIIQINSKSGLKGSNKNFAYAGGKFGGIGLTQSFALELMPYRIKVNSICPGNFFEGPLWSDPETGLFVQYLRAGKVPGAKSIADVKASYEKQVPAGRGCRVSDVMKAIFYVMDQEYETGQALPVTGGQEMLR